MPLSHIDIELTISRHQEGKYVVQLVVQQPNQESNLGSAEVIFDETLLITEGANVETYGRQLTSMLFADLKLQAGWVQAMGFQQAGRLLRVRLRLDETAESLHSFRWETLCDPKTLIPLSKNERLSFSRYLSSDDLTDLQAPYRPDLQALVAIANPSNLNDFGLSKVNVDQEVGRARTGLGDIPTTVLAQGFSTQRPTLTAILDALRGGANILYLICHGTQVAEDGQSYLWLENDIGEAEQISGEMLAEAISNLDHRPLLIILGCCESAGNSHSKNVLTTVGPRVARAGVAAVIAMLGQMTMKTLADLMPRFFTELRRHGQIDKALAAARSSLSADSSWWMPILFMRLKNGQLWHTEDLTTNRAHIRSWLLQRSNIVEQIGLDRLVDALLAHLRTVELNWEEYESLDALIEAVYTLDSTSHTVQALTQVLENVLPQPIPWPRVAQLQHILRSVSVYREELPGLFHRNAPRSLSIAVKETQSVSYILANMVRQLAKVPIDSSRRSQPLLAFVQDLIEGSAREPSLQMLKSLQDWNAEVAKHVGAILKVNVRETTAIQAFLLIVIRPPYSLIDVSPDVLDAVTFYVDAWLVIEPTVDELSSHRIPTRTLEYTKESLSEGVQAVIKDSMPLWPKQQTERTIEVFLPLPLLLADVDDWKIKLGLRPRPLGLEYHVVTRVLERVWSETKEELWHPWLKKWKRLQDIGGAYITTAIEWADRKAIADQDTLFALLLRDEIVGLIQTLTTSNEQGLSETQLAEMLISTIQAGIPVGLFLRQATQSPAQMRQMLQEMLQTSTFPEFPAFVSQQRRLAAAEPQHQHCGRYMTLVWDNPYRQPPEIEYDAP